jgi:hypothetical protein
MVVGLHFTGYAAIAGKDESAQVLLEKRGADTNF